MSEKSIEEARQDMRILIATGWKLKSETTEKYVVEKNTQKFGIHILIFLFTSWMTGTIMMTGGGYISPLFCFTGNVIYYFVSRKSRTIMK